MRKMLYSLVRLASMAFLLILASSMIPSVKAMADEPITSLVIGGITPPAGGMLPQTEGFTFDPDGVTVTKAAWLPEGRLKDGKIRPGESYNIEMTLEPKSGYYWGGGLSLLFTFGGGKIFCRSFFF